MKPPERPIDRRAAELRAAARRNTKPVKRRTLRGVSPQQASPPGRD